MRSKAQYVILLRARQHLKKEISKRKEDENGGEARNRKTEARKKEVRKSSCRTLTKVRAKRMKRNGRATKKKQEKIGEKKSGNDRKPLKKGRGECRIHSVTKEKCKFH